MLLASHPGASQQKVDAQWAANQIAADRKAEDAHQKAQELERARKAARMAGSGAVGSAAAAAIGSATSVSVGSTPATPVRVRRGSASASSSAAAPEWMVTLTPQKVVGTLPLGTTKEGEKDLFWRSALSVARLAREPRILTDLALFNSKCFQAVHLAKATTTCTVSVLEPADCKWLPATFALARRSLFRLANRR